MKRYVAAERMPWGLVHINAGEELVDPAPTGPLFDLLLKSGRVREMSAAEQKSMSASDAVVRGGTYGRRDMTAQPRAKESPPVRAPRSAAKPAGETTAGNVGAMTSANEPALTEKPSGKPAETKPGDKGAAE